MAQLEAVRLAATAAELGLEYVVITSVTRDDLPDGGAEAFVQAVQVLRERIPGARIELLVPDFQGSAAAITKIAQAAPDVIGHNLETVPRLYSELRPAASYERSLRLLAAVREYAPAVQTKTGVMLGLGEAPQEVASLMRDAKSHGVDIFTAGQYLRPSKECVPVSAYLSEDEFACCREQAQAAGFRQVFVGPLVRSSYRAAEVFQAGAAATVTSLPHLKAREDSHV